MKRTINPFVGFKSATYEMFENNTKSWDQVSNEEVEAETIVRITTGDTVIIPDDLNVSNNGSIIVDFNSTLQIYGDFNNNGRIVLRNNANIEFLNINGTNEKIYNNNGTIELNANATMKLGAENESNIMFINRKDGNVELKNGSSLVINDNTNFVNLNTRNGVRNYGSITGNGNYKYVEGADVSGGGAVDVTTKLIDEDDIEDELRPDDSIDETDLNDLEHNILKPLVTNKYEDIIDSAFKKCCGWNTDSLKCNYELTDNCETFPNAPGYPGKTKIQLLCCSNNYTVRKNDTLKNAVKKETRRNALNVISYTIRSLELKNESLTTFSTLSASNSVSPDSPLLKIINTNKELVDLLYNVSLGLSQLSLSAARIRNYLLNHNSLSDKFGDLVNNVFNNNSGEYMCLNKNNHTRSVEIECYDDDNNPENNNPENNMYPASCESGSNKWDSCNVSSSFYKLLNCGRNDVNQECQLSQLFNKCINYSNSMNVKIVELIRNLSNIGRNIVFGRESDIELKTIFDIGKSLGNEPSILMNIMNYIINIVDLNRKDSTTRKRWIEFLTSSDIEQTPNDNVVFDSDFKLNYNVSELTTNNVVSVINGSILANYKQEIKDDLSNILTILKNIYSNSNLLVTRIYALQGVDTQKTTLAPLKVTTQVATDVVSVDNVPAEDIPSEDIPSEDIPSEDIPSEEDQSIIKKTISKIIPHKEKIVNTYLMNKNYIILFIILITLSIMIF